LGDANGMDEVGSAAVATGAGMEVVNPVAGGRGEAVSVGFTLTTLGDGKLQAKMNIEMINKTRIRCFIMMAPITISI
jgi:hypothetical protein